MATLRVAGLNKNSIVDGPGLRYTVYFQGCKHNCKGCHNPYTHDMEAGTEVYVSSLIDDIISERWLDGVTLSGGDPIEQPEAAGLIAMASKINGKSIWVYTGYTFEQIKQMAEEDEHIENLLRYIDVLVDGRFILEERTLNKPFVGSSNQRLIDVQKSMMANEVILLEL